MPSKSIAFGLVNVPIILETLTKSDAKTGTPGRNYICVEHGEKCET